MFSPDLLFGCLADSVSLFLPVQISQTKEAKLKTKYIDTITLYHTDRLRQLEDV
jgi:hypothetical protein